MIDFAEVKVFVGGIQGSGKTYFTTTNLIPSFNNPVVYAMHPSDFSNIEHEKLKIVIPSNYSMEELDKVSAKIKQMAINGECDTFIIDEADMFLPNNKETLKKSKNFYDLLINHRHYKKGYPKFDDKNLKGLNLTFISRRPQSLPSEAVEQCEHLIVFAIEGDNAIKKLENIDYRFKELLRYLKKDKHNFIHKRVGEKPVLCSSVELVELNSESGSNKDE